MSGMEGASATEESAGGPRRRIPVWAIVAAIVLAVVVAPPLTVTLVNDAAAQGVESDLRAFPLPPGTELLGSASRAGKLSGNGNGMQYLGAIFVRSDLDIPALQAFYDDVTADTRLSVTVSDAGAFDEVDDAGARFAGGWEAGTRVVWAWGAGPGALFEEFDLRGH